MDQQPKPHLCNTLAEVASYASLDLSAIVEGIAAESFAFELLIGCVVRLFNRSRRYYRHASN